MVAYTVLESVMEHLVRVQNERDRRTLAWLRSQVGDAAVTEAARRCGGASKPYLSAVCRTLGVTAPRFRTMTPSAAAEQSLATIRQILASTSRQWRSAPGGADRR